LLSALSASQSPLLIYGGGGGGGASVGSRNGNKFHVFSVVAFN